MYSSRISFAIVSHFIRSIIVLEWITITVVSRSVGAVNEKLPTAAKLTISIDQVSPSLPPQIAYFIPDSALNNFLNRTILDGAAFNRSIQTLRPPPAPPLRPNMFSANDFGVPMVDSMAAPQSKYRYVVMPKHYNRDYDESDDDDSETAYQNYAYDVNYKPLKEKKSNYWRYQAYENENDGITSVEKKYVKKEKHPSSHKYHNYNPTSIRDQLNYLRKNHRDHFADDTDNERDDVDANSERIIDGRGVAKKRHKKKKVHRKKQRVPTSSYESDDTPNYAFAAVPHHNHKDCDSDEISNNQDAAVDAVGDYDDDYGENYPVRKTVVPQKRKKSRNKGLTFYITKVRNPDTNTERMLRIDKVGTNDEDQPDMEAAFVPTRYLASVRGTEQIVYKKKHRAPAKPKKPHVKERLTESGGHVVYTEDGYEDKQYDNGSQEMYLNYRHRARRETLPEASELKGQELIEHIDGLIKNASDTLTSVDEDLKKRGRYPFYNSNITNLNESPLRYAEHDEPFRANESNSYYDTKTKLCNEIDNDVNVTTDNSDPVIPNKRLKNLGNKIDCVKEKLFGENPLDNPIFGEYSVSEPTAEAVFGSDSSVYTDVMENIGYNKNQRVFSSYGISDNYDLSAIDTLTVKNRPGNSLNTNEKYPRDDISDSIENGDSSSDHEQTYQQNPFQNPAQVPILDISKFIPRPHPSLPAAPLFESDFVPITMTTEQTEPPTTHMTPPKVHAVPVRIPVIISAKPFYRGRHQPPRKHPGNSQQRLSPNVFVLRRGQTMAIVRVPPPNKPR